MKTNINNRIIVFVVISILSLLLFTMFAFSYDRGAARDYARYWSEDTGILDTGKANTAHYYNLGADDCANFVSQCLIAGGLRFRSSTNSNDNTREPLLGHYHEIDTGAAAMSIIDSNIKNYSRTITNANDLGNSIKHSRHGGTEYTIPNLIDAGTLWSNLKHVQKGDICFTMEDDGNGGFIEHYKHAMFISDVDTNSNPNVLEYCAHSKWRKDHDLENTTPGWKTTGEVRVICLPDAPTIFGPPIIYSGANRIKWKWGVGGNQWCVENFQQSAVKADLVLKLTFDTDMKTEETPEIKLLVGSNYISFSPWSDTGYTNGWWTNASISGFTQNRSWKGCITAGSLPTNWHGMPSITIRARAIDGTYNDSTDELSKYDATNYCKVIHILLDTRISNGTSTRP